MKIRLSLLTLLAIACLLIGNALPAWADILYENGPINGETDAWTINFGFLVSDSFTISTGNSTVSGLSFGAWLFPGDVLESSEVILSQYEAGGGTVYFDGDVNFTQSNCFLNNYSYDVCTETGSFTPVNLGNGTYWLTLESAVVNNGDPVYWDENNGVGCHSPGCPSDAGNGGIGTLPSESFSILGTPGTGTVPEPSALLLFASGVVAVAGTLRRKWR